jgi:hypothetical protein
MEEYQPNWLHRLTYSLFVPEPDWTLACPVNDTRRISDFYAVAQTDRYPSGLAAWVQPFHTDRVIALDALWNLMRNQW